MNTSISDIVSLMRNINITICYANRERGEYENGVSGWYRLGSTGRSVWVTVWTDGCYGISSNTRDSDFTDDFADFFELDAQSEENVLAAI